MGKQEGESRWWAHSTTSTVLLYPAVFVENWKRQIQGKEGIPSQQQRLTFKVASQEEEEGQSERQKESTCSGSVNGGAASELIQDLQTWKALLRCNGVIVGTLEEPSVEPESEQSVPNLYCQAAQELRTIGVPCNVFYLSFDKWIPATKQLGVPQDCQGIKVPTELSIEVDKSSNYRIDLIGRLEGKGEALVFEYGLNGGEIHTQLSMQKQKAQYRMRHHELRSQMAGKEVAGRDPEYADHNGQKHPLKCSNVVLAVITIPDTRRKPEQLVQPSSFLPDREGRSDAADVKKDFGVLLSPSRLTHVNSTETTCHSNHRSQLEHSKTQKSLNHPSSAPHRAEHAADISLLFLEQQAPPSTSEDPVSSSCTAFPVETEGVTGAGESDSLALKEGATGKQCKKKKKKKGKKRTTKAGVQIGDGQAHDAEVLPVEGLRGQDHRSPESPLADGRMHPASLVPDIDDSGRLENVSKKSRINSSGDGNVLERESRTASLPRISSEVGLKSPIQRSIVGGQRQGLLSGSELENSTWRNWSSLPCGAKDTFELSFLNLETPSPEMGCIKSNDNLQSILQSKNGRSSAEKALHCGLNNAASYCTDSGRLAPVKFLKEVYTTIGIHEQGTSGPSGTVLLDSCQIDPGAARDINSQSGKNPGIATVLDTLGDSGQISQPKDSIVEGQIIRMDVKANGLCGGSNGMRNGQAGGAPSEGNGTRWHGRTSEERRGASFTNTGGMSQASGQNTTSGSDISTGGGLGGGGNGNRWGSRGCINVSGGGGGDNDWPCENETNGNKERRKASEIEDRSLRHGDVAGGSGDLLSGDYLQKKKFVGINLEQRVRRIPAGDAAQNGTGSTATMQSFVNSAVGKENRSVWKPKLLSQEDESLFEAARQRISDSGENGIGMAFQHHIIVPHTATCGGYVNNFTDRGHTFGNAVSEGLMSKHPAVVYSDQNSRRNVVDDYANRSSRKPIYSTDTGSKIGQSQSVREINSWHAPTDHLLPNGGYIKHRMKEGSLSHTQEAVKLTLDKKVPPYNGSDEELQSASKGAPEVSRNGRTAKYLNLRPASVHFLQQTTSFKESHVPDGCPAFGTRSAPSTPYSHSGEASLYGTRDALLLHQDALSGPTDARYHATGVANSGHISDSRLNQEDLSHRWKSGRRAATDHERRLPERFGLDKERSSSSAPLQKWVPVDKGSTNMQRLLGSRDLTSGVEILNAAASSCCDSMMETGRSKTTSSATQLNIAAYVQEESMKEADSVYVDAVSKVKDDVGNVDIPLPGLLQQFPMLSLGSTQLASSESTVEPIKGANTACSQFSVKTDLVLANGEGHSCSRQGLISKGVSEMNVGVSPSECGSTDRLETSTVGGSPTGEPCMVMEAECEPEEVDAATQQLNLLVTNMIDCTRKGREASEAFARLSGAPLAEIERVLCAVSPAIDSVQEFKEHSPGQPSTSCDCSMNRGGRTHQQMCSCELANVPISAIWNWFEKPSTYGVEVLALDTLRNETGMDNYFAYFVPYLSGIQLYGYKGKRYRPGTCAGQDSLMPAVSKQRDMHQEDKEKCGASAVLLFEFFEGDQPAQRQPFLQKIQDLRQEDTSFNSQSSGDASCLDSALLGDLHPASWFAVAWYPIYRISDGPMRSVFLTYYSVHHGIANNTLRCSLGQFMDLSDGRIVFPVVGLECYNTQSERWLALEVSEEFSKGIEEKSATSPGQILKQRLHSLQEAAAILSRKLPVTAKHLDYEFVISRRR